MAKGFLAVAAGLAAFIIAGRVALAVPATLPATTPVEPSVKDVRDIFGTTELWTVHIQISADGWEMMQPDRTRGLADQPGRSIGARIAAIFKPRPATRPAAQPVAGPATRPTTGPATQAAAGQKPVAEGERLSPNPFGLRYAYVRGTFQFEDQTYHDVGVRLKGNSSYTAAGTGLKRPYKIDFNRFIQGQRFHGLATLNLHNNAYDPTYMREALSYEVFREAGVPASRTACAVLFLTIDGQHKRECLGFYTIVEEVDKRFLKEHFKNGKGLLLKPEGTRGLPYLGEQWSQYELRYRPKTDVTPALSRRFIEFVKLVNDADDETFRKQIESYLAVDPFLRFLAVHALLASMDSFMVLGHNYYIYVNPEDNKVHWIPWDLNLSFGGFTAVGTPEQLMELSIDYPYPGEYKLIQRLLAIEQYKIRYHEHLKKFTADFYNPDHLHKRIDALAEVVARAQQISKAAGKEDKPTTRPGMGLWTRKPDLKQFVTRRVESVATQLAGKSEGYRPAWMRRGGAMGNRTGVPAAIATIVLREADVDRDKMISRGELKTTLRRCFEAIDQAGQGGLDEKTLGERLARIAAPAGPQQNGRAANAAGPASANQGPILARAIMKEADADKNGLVSLQEVSMAAIRLFAEVDKDKSNRLNEGEIADAIARLIPPLPDRR